MSGEQGSTGQTKLTGQLSLLSVVAFGVSYMSPSMVVVVFGVVATTSAGTAPTAFLLATGAMLLTGLSYARMARLHPGSGSAYSYTRHFLGAPAGFLVGWTVLLDYLFLPMVAWLVQSIFLNAQFPAVPVWAWMLMHAVATTMVNIVGVKVADRVNLLCTSVAVFVSLLFIGYLTTYLGHHWPGSCTAPLWNAHSEGFGISSAASVAAYSYLGFDAVTTLSEETRDPERTIPRAVILVLVIGGLLSTGTAYLMQLVHPGGLFDDPEIIGYTMAAQIGGQTFADWTNTADLIAGFASVLAVQLASSRLLFSMGRDGVLPKRVFGRLHPRTGTPVLCLLFTGAMCLLGLDMSLETATSFINFGAFLAFSAVNVCVIAHYLRNRTSPRLGVAGHVVAPALGLGVTVYLLSQLSATALTIGSCRLAIGFGHLLWLTRGFRRPTPEMSLDDEPAATGHVEKEAATPA
ncbi:APC family permease [Streptomyces sp. NPDC047017]|uniref:APC family permease n=1 Tax=Streptomyces sp. NPDC047017 TaxID=3155024 RepID=UPI0033D86056